MKTVKFIGSLSFEMPLDSQQSDSGSTLFFRDIGEVELGVLDSGSSIGVRSRLAPREYNDIK